MRVAAKALALLVLAPLALGALPLAAASGRGTTAHAWQPRAKATFDRMMRNVSPKGARRGAVVAAPAGNPQYQYHWVRDAALTMDELLGALEKAKTDTERQSYVQKYK